MPTAQAIQVFNDVQFMQLLLQAEHNFSPALKNPNAQIPHDFESRQVLHDMSHGLQALFTVSAKKPTSQVFVQTENPVLI